MECYVCGLSETRVQLFDAIGREGFVKICERCSYDTNIPIIKKPTSNQLKEADRKPSVYERLSNAAGVNPNTHKGYSPHDTSSMRSLVDKKYDSILPLEKPTERTDLITNFHWLIMRARRSKKMNQAQFAEFIHEPEEAVKMAEIGILPNDDDKLLMKIQKSLGIILYKVPPKKEFTPTVSDQLTIADLKELKKMKDAKKENDSPASGTPTTHPNDGEINTQETKKEKKGFFSRFFTIDEDVEESSVSGTSTIRPNEEVIDVKENSQEENVSEKKTKKDLSEEEIHDMIFGSHKKK